MRDVFPIQLDSLPDPPYHIPVKTKRTRLILLLAPLLFFLHDLEEIQRMPAFITANADRLPVLYANISPASQFILAIAVLTALTLVVAILAARAQFKALTGS